MANFFYTNRNVRVEGACPIAFVVDGSADGSLAWLSFGGAPGKAALERIGVVQLMDERQARVSSA